MNDDIQKLRDLIARNKMDMVFEMLSQLSGSDPDINNQVLILSSRFNDIRKKENLNLISSGEASIIRSQVNYAILDLISGYEKNKSSDSSIPGMKTVFISYNHNDFEVANRLKEKLQAENINVTIDSETMEAGEDIKNFIEKSVRNTAATISIISKKSLLSAWVAMETIDTYYSEKNNTNKKFIACYIEDDFFRRDFTDDALNFIDDELKEIEMLKKARSDKGRNTRDLNNEYTRLKELSNGMDEIIRRLRESLCIDIRDEKLDTNFIKILQTIRS